MHILKQKELFWAENVYMCSLNAVCIVIYRYQFYIPKKIIIKFFFWLIYYHSKSEFDPMTNLSPNVIVTRPDLR